MGIENIFENISLKQMSSNIKTIQEMLNDFNDSRVTYADVTTKTLPEVFKDMGYEVGQLPDGSWGMIKSSTTAAEANTYGIVPTQGTSVTVEPVNTQIMDVIDSSGEVVTTIGSTSKIDNFMAVANPVVLFGTLAATAAYLGYRLGSDDYESDPEFWNKTMKVIFGEPTPYAMMDEQMYLPFETIDSIYAFFGSMGGEEGEYVDPQGNPDDKAYTDTISYFCSGTNSADTFKFDVQTTVRVSGGILQVGRIHTPNYPLWSYSLGWVPYANGSGRTVTVQEDLVVKKTDLTTGDVTTTTTPRTYTFTGSTNEARTILLNNVRYYCGSSSGITNNLMPPSYIPSAKLTNVLFSPIPHTVLNSFNWGGYNWCKPNTDLTPASDPHAPEKVSGAVVPEKGVPLATKYPTWYSNRKVTNSTFSSKSDLENTKVGEGQPKTWLPVLPLSADMIANITAPIIDSLHDLSKKISDLADNDINPDIQESVQAQEDDKTKDATDDGTDPRTPTPIDTGDTGDPEDAVPVAGGEKTGFVQIYHPDRATVAAFSQWLWSSGFDLDTFKKLFQDPMSAIISLHQIYATPTDAGTDNIVVGYIDSGVSSKYITKTTVEIDCGSLTIPEYYNNALDYDPYTEVLIYLPFIGFKQLSANDVIGNNVQLVYNIDVITGVCVAMIYVNKNGSKVILYTFEGNCCVQIPITSSNFSSIISGVIGTAASIGATILTGGAAAPVAMVAGANLLGNSRVGVERSGALGGNGGALAPKIPYIVIKRPIAKIAYNYQDIMGYPASVRVKLSRCSGFTRVKEIILDDVKATAKEKSALEAILKSGVEF